MQTGQAIASVVTMAAIGACDPIAAVTVKSALRTTPATDCPQRALAQSSLVDSTLPAASFHNAGTYTVMARLRNPQVIQVLYPWVFVDLKRTTKDSSELEVKFRLPGRTTWAVDDEDSRRLAEIGRALADDVVTTCAPASATKFSCRVSGMFWTKGCGRA